MPHNVTLLLLHGAGTGAWIWDRVIRELASPSIALDIPRHSAGATPGACAQRVVSEPALQNVDSIVVVLHSLAGVLAPGLSRLLGSRLQRIVYVSGVIPPPGGAFVDALGLADRLILKALFKFNREGLIPSPAMIRRQLCNDLSPDDSELVLSRYQAELPGLFLSPVEGSAADNECSYVKLLRDKSLSPSRQDSMIARLKAPNLHEVDSGHLVMLSQPRALADILEDEAVRV